MTVARCPGCPTGMRATTHYLCRACWFALSDAARRALDRRDGKAFYRLRDLHRQLDEGVPLAEIRITA